MSEGKQGSWRWHLLAALLFAAGFLFRYHALLGEDLSQVALLADFGRKSLSPSGLPAADLRFVVWLVARNAHTLLTSPLDLFQAEPCAPAMNALALGEPGVTLGLLGTPAWLLTRDPLLTFHGASFLALWISAFAMYWLVLGWTGRPAAAIAAGLLFGFHPLRTSDPVHPYVHDVAWTVLALHFATGLARRGRWRDAVGLGVCIALQMGGSLYPLLGSVAIGLPVGIWLLASYGLRRLRPGPLLLAAAIPLLAACVIFPPFLELRAEGTLVHRIALFMPWSSLLPGGGLFPGWLFLALAVLGCSLRPARGAPDPRWALLVGWLLCTCLAAGGNEGEILATFARGDVPTFALPNPYNALAAFVPGLDVVRAPMNLYIASHLALAALAGLGVAALQRRVPARFSAPVAATVVVAAGVEVLGPGVAGLAPRPDFVPVQIAPPPEALRFFAELEASGNTGPVFNAAVNPKNLRRVSQAVLLSAYHHRRTNACYGSFRPAEDEEVSRLEARLPGRAALRGLAELGFTTVVFERSPQTGISRLERKFIGAAAEQLRGASRPIRSSGAWSAWSLLPEDRAPRVARPNIVLIIGDDLGWPDYGFMGSETAYTPNLDQLAEEGVVFPYAFNTSSTCRPSLLTLATGLQLVQVRATVGRRGDVPALSRNVIRAFHTLPGLLAAHGYAAFQGGKWWEGSYSAGGFTDGMTRGADAAIPSGGEESLKLGRETMQPLWDFLEEHKQQPFFVWFAPMLPHTPFDAPEEFMAHYTDAGASAYYLANVTRFDARVGELLARLEELGLRERTLVVYLSDNGWDAHSGGPPHVVLGDGARGKASVYELGFRTPLIFSMPGRLAPRSEAEIVSTVDLFPTLLGFAGVETPKDRPGRSLLPVLAGEIQPPRRLAFGGGFRWRSEDPELPFVEEPAWFARSKQWRLILYPRRNERELYRIDEDPFETTDLAEEHPLVAAALERKLRAWLADAHRPRPPERQKAAR